MALGFSKHFDMSNYDVDQFIELWPETSELGINLTEEVMQKTDESFSLTPGSKDPMLRYIKSAMFVLGFSEVDMGQDPDLYDQYTSSAVVRTKNALIAFGREIEPGDSIDRSFVENMNDIFEISSDAQLVFLYDALDKVWKTGPLEISAPEQPAMTAPKTSATATTKVTIPPPSSGNIGIKPGVNYPVNPRMAKNSVLYSLAKDGNKQLSQNFKVSDFRSQGSDVVLINPELINVLEKIQAHFGKKIKITSGYRTPKLNKSLEDTGAAPNSQHMYGNAADIQIPGVTPREVCDWLNPWHPGGLGLYARFTHVDVRHTVGENIARWGGLKKPTTLA